MGVQPPPPRSTSYWPINYKGIFNGKGAGLLPSGIDITSVVIPDKGLEYGNRVLVAGDKRDKGNTLA